MNRLYDYKITRHQTHLPHAKLVWFYEGLVPKILFCARRNRPVRAYHLVLLTPEFTLQILESRSCSLAWLSSESRSSRRFIATLCMSILIGLVANGNPSMLTDPRRW